MELCNSDSCLRRCSEPHACSLGGLRLLKSFYLGGGRVRPGEVYWKRYYKGSRGARLWVSGPWGHYILRHWLGRGHSTQELHQDLPVSVDEYLVSSYPKSMFAAPYTSEVIRWTYSIPKSLPACYYLPQVYRFCPSHPS